MLFSAISSVLPSDTQLGKSEDSAMNRFLSQMREIEYVTPFISTPHSMCVLLSALMVVVALSSGTKRISHSEHIAEHRPFPAG
jgi:high-affinity nickel permease